MREAVMHSVQHSSLYRSMQLYVGWAAFQSWESVGVFVVGLGAGRRRHLQPSVQVTHSHLVGVLLSLSTLRAGSQGQPKK